MAATTWAQHLQNEQHGFSQSRMLQLSDDSSKTIQNPGNLVLGMGVGTFIIAFFGVVLFFIFVFSAPCTKTEKIVWRGSTFVVFVIIILILIFAERESQFYYASYSPRIYDYSIIPRIAIGLVLCVFGIVSVVFLADHFGETREVGPISLFPFC